MTDWFFNSDFCQFFLLRVLKLIGFTPKDPTFGRRSLPPTLGEKELRAAGLFCGERWVQDGNNKIYFQTYWDQKNFPTPKADGLFIHGYADHGGRYPKVFLPYIQAGLRLHFLDLPYHGRSDGVHAGISDLEELKLASKQVLYAIKQQFSIDKMFILGQSLGGQVAINLSIEEAASVKGLVAYCPCIQVHDMMRPHDIIVAIGRFLTAIFPNLIIVPRDPNMGSKDPDIDTKFVNDPMTYSRGLRGTTGFAIEDGLKAFKPKLHQLEVPFLILQGENDRMVDPIGANIVLETAISKDKKLLTYPETEHALFDEPNSDIILKDALDWIVAHINKC